METCLFVFEKYREIDSFKIPAHRRYDSVFIPKIFEATRNERMHIARRRDVYVITHAVRYDRKRINPTRVVYVLRNCLASRRYRQCGDTILIFTSPNLNACRLLTIHRFEHDIITAGTSPGQRRT